LLLVVDRVIAEVGSALSLPAGREGLIPGAAPARLARRIGGQAARQVVLFGRTFQAGASGAELICDTTAESGTVDAVLDLEAATLSGSGLLSTGGNRKAIRLGEESLDDFRRYMAMFARQQADCLYSPALIRNLECHWMGRQGRRHQE
jgi:thioesterase DpgC